MEQKRNALGYTSEEWKILMLKWEEYSKKVEEYCKNFV